jgi:Concanavalin A-like lectin/glucanases superfamily
MAGRGFSRWLLVLGAVACEPNVVDAVRDPPPKPVEVPPSPLLKVLHRYSFDGQDVAVLDSKGAEHGEVIGTTLPGYGALPLAGTDSGQYVDLPNGIVSVLTDATFEAWLTWMGGRHWQRIFDFGFNSSGEEGLPGPTGTSYLFFTASAPIETTRMLAPGLRVSYSNNGVADEEVCQSPATLPIGVPVHVAVVVSRAEETVALYQDGALLTSCPLARPLSDIEDVNNWLGHSNYESDDDFYGIFDEFRIYGAALSADEIASSYEAGPDAK